MSIFNLIKKAAKIFADGTSSEDSSSTRYSIGADIKDDSEFELEWNETDEGRGFVVRRIADGQRLEWRILAKSDGLESVPIVGVSYRKKVLQDPSFAPGKALEILPEPDNPRDPNAIGIWNQEKTLQIGYIPKEYSAGYARLLKSPETEKIGCMSMGEHLEGKKRVGLRVLIVYEQAKIEGLHFHDLPHTFATRLTQAGINLFAIQRFLGQKTPLMTHCYAHHSAESL